MPNRPYRVLTVALLMLCLPALSHSADQSASSRAAGKSIERGRYMVKIAGCNDCHTKGYPESAGAVPEKDWLTGSPLGHRGPWGTTYPANLRLAMTKMTEAEWVKAGHTTQYRPPMPWFALRDMSHDDLRAIYRFVRFLGPAGTPAPAYVPPGQTPDGPVVQYPG